MSENYRFYSQRMAELRARATANRPLRAHLVELFAAVRDCEARWALEERVERGNSRRPAALRHGSPTQN
jgi:hypothetical protein